MVVYYFSGKGRYNEFPFWAGVLALGWFAPQAIGGYLNASEFPAGAYSNGMFFAALCTLALWVGFAGSAHRIVSKPTWLDAVFEINRLYVAGAMLCVVGFFFQWKLSTLPAELTSMTQWSGAAVKYLFLSNVFIFGFITLWLIYLSQPRLIVPRLWVFLVPCLLLLLDSAILKGRRATMMNLVSYLVVGAWLVRGISLPRWMMVAGLCLGLLLINGIEVYRTIMTDEARPLSERLAAIREADFSKSTASVIKDSGWEFKNYIFYRQIYAEVGAYDFGVAHWNELIFNYVPAQIVGRATKQALMLPLFDPSERAKEEYGHLYGTGTTVTGYADAFASFGWLGFLKYVLIGWLMGGLYRYAMRGAFLGQLLYVYSLGTAMHAISHGTHAILVSLWIYFFCLGYPILYFAKLKPAPMPMQCAV